jgi:hypothetical protein
MIPVDQLGTIINALVNLKGPTMITTIEAVTLAVQQPFMIAFGSIMAGLAANGISPRL